MFEKSLFAFVSAVTAYFLRFSASGTGSFGAQRFVQKAAGTVFILVAVLSSMPAMAAITQDVSISHDQLTAATTNATPAFSTKSGEELLLAYVSADAVSSPNSTVTKITGGNLTWVLVVRSNAQAGTSEIWRAFAPSPLSNIVVTANLSQSVLSSLTVQSFTGVGLTGTNGAGAIGAVDASHASGGAPAARLVTTQNNSVVVGVGNDYDQAISHTPLSGQLLIHQDLSSTGDTYWMQRLNSATASAGTTVILGDSAPTTDQYNLAICEIVAAAAAAAPKLTVSASTLSFGSVADGTTKALNLTLTSTGTSPVTISADAITGTGFTAAAGTLPKTLSPGQSLVVPVTFAPKSSGAFTGKLTFNSNSSSGSVSTVTLSGSGASANALLTLSASTLAFGSVVDNSSKVLSLTLTSSGNEAVTVQSDAITGAGFSAAPGTLPKTLSPGQSLVVPVTFAPKSSGALTGKLTFNSNASSGSVSTVTLSGTGASANALLTLSASTLAFGSVVDNSSKVLSLTLTSSGNEAVTVQSDAITGAGFSAAPGTLPKTLSPGQTLVIPVTFAPLSAGAVSGKLTVTSNATTGATASVTLTATGAAATRQLSLSATTLSFGTVSDGTPKALSLTLTSSGNSAVTIDSDAIKGAGFTAAPGTLPKTLSPGQTLAVPITFAPTTVGAVSGALSFASNSTQPLPSVTLTGTGSASTAPQLKVSATSLSFGTVTMGNSASLSVTLTSTGTAPVTLSSITLAGAEFAIMSGMTTPVTLNPQQSSTVSLEFTPATAGAASGTLTIHSNSQSGASTTIALTGTGAASTQTVELDWTSPTSSADPIAGYHIYRSASGGAMALLNSTLDVQTTFTDSNITAGTTYSYEVKSVDYSGVESTPTSVLSVTIPSN